MPSSLASLIYLKPPNPSQGQALPKIPSETSQGLHTPALKPSSPLRWTTCGSGSQPGIGLADMSPG